MITKLMDTLEQKFLWKSPARALSVYERVPRFMLKRFRLQNLRRTLTLVKTQSRYYKELFSQHPFEIRSILSPSDLPDFFTSQEDLVKFPIEDFLCGTAQTAFETTGTSSRVSKRILFSYRELEDAGRVGSVGLWRLGIRPEDRVASAFDYSFWVSGPALQSSLKNMGAFHVEAGRLEPDDFYERIKPYQCNVIVADPGWLVRLSEYAEKKGPWPMKCMLIGGENLSERARQFVEKVWDTKVLLTYGQTEAFGMVGIECEAQDGYHLNDMDLWPEIPKTDEAGYGELVYTTLRRCVMPLIRYRSGDVTRIITDPCSCGVPSLRLAKLKGRADEMVVTGVGNIAPWMVEDVMSRMSPMILEWQLCVQHEGTRDLLECRVENSQKLSDKDLRTKLMNAMQSGMPVARQGIMNGLAAFKVRSYETGTLRKGRKIKRILDQRNYTNDKPPSAKRV